LKTQGNKIYAEKEREEEREKYKNART
jgi:hypothetical protein